VFVWAFLSFPVKKQVNRTKQGALASGFSKAIEQNRHMGESTSGGASRNSEPNVFYTGHFVEAKLRANCHRAIIYPKTTEPTTPSPGQIVIFSISQPETRMEMG
jgi:hypothetical protein